MNFSPHLLIDAVILSTALTISLILRAKGNQARKERETKWLPKKKLQNTKSLNFLGFGISYWMQVFLLLVLSWFIYTPLIYL